MPEWSIDLATNELFCRCATTIRVSVGIVPPVDGQEYTRGDIHELEEVRLLTSICGSWMSFCFCEAKWTSASSSLSNV
jgi:hypothetical protein